MPARGRIISAGLVGALASAALLSAAPAAGAAPVHPTHWWRTAVGHSSVTVRVGHVRHATSYRVVVSSSRAHLTVAYLRGHHLRSDHSARATGNLVTVSGLPFRTTPYYFRVGVTDARHENHVAWAPTASKAFALAPLAPTGLRAVSGPAGHFLVWRQHGSTGAVVDATESGTGRHLRFQLNTRLTRFTPYGLTAGRRYTFRVRATNLTATSAASNAATVIGTRETSVRVMSYNLLGAHLVSGVDPAGRTARYAGWTQRVQTAAALVASYHPDVLAVQEGNTIFGSSGTAHVGNHAYPSAAWPGEWPIPARSCNHFYGETDQVYGGGATYWPYRQVDSLCDTLNTRLGGTVYARAIDGTAKHNGSGNYVVYNAGTMSQPSAADLHVAPTSCWGSDDPKDRLPAAATAAMVRCGGYFTVDDDPTDPTRRTAAWAVLQKRSGGARMLVLSPHLSSELGAGFDARRAAQIRSLLRLAQAKGRQLGVTRIVLAGDYNTYLGRRGVPDTTTAATRAAGYADAIENAQRSINTGYLSGNLYSSPPARRPGGRAGYSCLDHLYLAPGIAVRTFGEALHLDIHGRVVGAIASDHNPVWADLTLQG